MTNPKIILMCWKCQRRMKITETKGWEDVSSTFFKWFIQNGKSVKKFELCDLCFRQYRLAQEKNKEGNGL